LYDTDTAKQLNRLPTWIHTGEKPYDRSCIVLTASTMLCPSSSALSLFSLFISLLYFFRLPSLSSLKEIKTTMTIHRLTGHIAGGESIVRGLQIVANVNCIMAA
jgi:hypothetical protein